MKLHEAIEKILRDNNRPMSAKEIADDINSNALYQRGDGTPVPGSQISARVNNYPSLFIKNAGKVFLRSFVKKIQNTGLEPLKPLSSSPSASMPAIKEIKLHEAIDLVLRKNKRPMSPLEIATCINEQNLYKRNDLIPVPASQIYMRAKNYQHLFELNPDGLIARNKTEIDNLLDTAMRMQTSINQNSPFMGISIKQIHLLIPAIFFFKRMLDNPESLKSQLKIQNAVFQFGYDGYLKFLNELNTGSNVFNGKLNKLIKDAENLSILLPESKLLVELQDLNLSATEINTQDFGIFFNEIIYTSGKLNMKAGELITPKTIGDLFYRLISQNITTSTCIYNPASGFATIPAVIAQKSKTAFKFSGEEINHDVFVLAAMNLIVNGIDTDSFQNTDSLQSNNSNSTFDYAFCFPPLIGKYHDKSIQDTFAVNTDELTILFLQKCLASLNSSGRGFILIPDMLLNSNQTKYIELRRFLLNEKLIEGIISLPDDLLYPETNIKTSILIVSNLRNEKITFLDAENFILFKRKSQDASKIFAEKIFECYYSSLTTLFDNIIQEPVAGYGLISKIVKPYKKLEAKNPVLSVKINILLEDQSEDDKKPLFTVLERLQDTNTHHDGKAPYVNIGDLNNDPFKVYLDESKLNIDSNLKNGRLIYEPVLLISSIAPKVKPTFYRPQKGPIIVSPNIHVFMLKDSIIDLEYLVLQLSNEEFEKQLVAYAVGITSLKRVRVNDFLNLKIKLPSIEEQKEIVRIQKEGVYAAKIAEASDFAKKSGLTAKSEKELLSFLKHEVGNISGGLNNDIVNLKNYIDRKGIDLNEKVSQSSKGASLGMVFNRMQANMMDIDNLMKNIEAIINLSDSNNQKSQINFVDFLKTECEKNPLIKDNGIKLIFTSGDFSHSLINENILIIENQFSILIRNFVINAIKHGFTDELTEKIILFSLEEDEDFYYIRLLNNGLPLPENFTLEDYLKFGGRHSNKKGSGIGGFLIGKVVENHNGTIELISTDKLIYIDTAVNDVHASTGIALKAGIHFLIKLPKE